MINKEDLLKKIDYIRESLIYDRRVLKKLEAGQIYKAKYEGRCQYGMLLSVEIQDSSLIACLLDCTDLGKIIPPTTIKTVPKHEPFLPIPICKMFKFEPIHTEDLRSVLSNQPNPLSKFAKEALKILDKPINTWPNLFPKISKLPKPWNYPEQTSLTFIRHLLEHRVAPTHRDLLPAFLGINQEINTMVANLLK